MNADGLEDGLDGASGLRTRGNSVGGGRPLSGNPNSLKCRRQRRHQFSLEIGATLKVNIWQRVRRHHVHEGVHADLWPTRYVN